MSIVSSVMAGGAAISVLAGKSKMALVGLKVLKLKPLISMALSTWAYSLFYGWPFAAGMVGLIFVHEVGHIVVMRHYGIPFSPMVFVPFMGAAIAMEEEAKDAYDEAMIAFGGPVLGSIGALGTLVAAEATGSQLLFALADFGFMVNLFNLLPVGSMDGGRIGAAISPVVSGLGLLGGGALAFQGSIQNPIFYLILLGGCYSFASRIMGWEEHAQRGPHYYNIGRGKQAVLSVAYLGLMAALFAAMSESSRRKKTPKQLQYERDHGYGDEEETLPWGPDDLRFPVEDDDEDAGSGGFGKGW